MLAWFRYGPCEFCGAAPGDKCRNAKWLPEIRTLKMPHRGRPVNPMNAKWKVEK